LMLTSLSIWGWGSLGVVLFLITFGPFAIFYFAFYILCFVGGGFVVTLLFGKSNSEKYLEQCEHSFLPCTSVGIPKCIEEMKREARPIKIDRRLTGANIIDEPLQQVIQFSLRDYVQYWYYTLSDDESFLLEIRQALQYALVQFSARSKETDWQPYFTTRLVDDFGTHLRVFRKAQQRIAEKGDQMKDQAEELVDTFFEVEVEMEKEVCRDLVCTSPKDEEGFLRDLCEVLLYILLPPGDFQNKIMRYFCIKMFSKCHFVSNDNIGELEAVKDKASEELQYLRSLDTAGDDYMQQTGGQAHLFFWMTVEGYRVTAQQQLEVLQSRQRDGKHQTNQTKGLLRAAAVGVYEQYLSEKKILKPLLRIVNEKHYLYRIHVYDFILCCLFLPSALSLPLQSLDDLSNVPSDETVQLHAYISDTGVCNDHGKTYALYAITVHRRNANSEETWKTYRRYSDFHDFHMRITEQFENLANILKLPGKKTFNNMDRDFLEKRKKDLNAYLQLLLNPEMMKASPALAHYVYDFLENKAYSKGKGDFARKMDTFVNPLRNSMRNVSNAVKSLPDSLAEGMTKMSDNMGKMSERLGQDIKQSFFKVPPLIQKTYSDPDHCRVAATIDDSVDDNIPLRVMLLLMDEVFDLKERNQWLRRNIKNLLQQLIRATYGDTINRKIVDHVDWMTSPEQVADAVKRFRDAFWPNGILAETVPRRDKAIRMRTRVAGKTKLLEIMPDELKHIIGAETTRKGILRVFEMFQHTQLNKRMVYVFLERFLETLFPQNKFHELFNKLHSRSKQMQRYKQRLHSTQAPSLQKR
uniref:Sorting nexin 13 n=1 Tax=Meleagris gallopavo TaxID=9103 RepID=A0A803YDS2_MELGA